MKKSKGGRGSPGRRGDHGESGGRERGGFKASRHGKGKRASAAGPKAAQKRAAEASKLHYQAALSKAHRGAITTELRDAPEFYYAEEYHQQYLAKNPNGYCGIGGCGVRYDADGVPRPA